MTDPVMYECVVKRRNQGEFHYKITAWDLGNWLQAETINGDIEMIGAQRIEPKTTTT